MMIKLREKVGKIMEHNRLIKVMRGMNAVMKEMVDQRKEGGMVAGEEAGDEVSIIISIQGHLLNQVFH
jgi:hypothetical protein